MAPEWARGVEPFVKRANDETGKGAAPKHDDAPEVSLPTCVAQPVTKELDHLVAKALAETLWVKVKKVPVKTRQDFASDKSFRVWLSDRSASMRRASAAAIFFPCAVRR